MDSTAFVRRVADWVWTNEHLALLAREVDLDRPESHELALPEVRRLTTSDLVVACGGRWQGLEVILGQRAAMGAQALALVVAGRPVHVAWVCPKQLPIDRGSTIALGATDLGLFDMFTAPADRGHGYQRRMLEYVCSRFASATGMRRVFATVHHGNRPSWRHFADAGFHTAGEIVRRRRFGRNSVRANSAAAGSIASLPPLTGSFD